jgi:hypothetical protein
MDIFIIQQGGFLPDFGGSPAHFAQSGIFTLTLTE